MFLPGDLITPLARLDGGVCLLSNPVRYRVPADKIVGRVQHGDACLLITTVWADNFDMALIVADGTYGFAYALNFTAL
jgi:hypothetical protein